ncbi:MAG: endolytic transglycosylase MltG [Candidatus Pacebacteria bacterium]|nr:endolytic transglycosylase MltG [Candidatus Paceibacterota bacterium]
MMDPLLSPLEPAPVPPRSARSRMAVGIVMVFVVASVACAAVWFVHGLSPAGAPDSAQAVFEIKQGEGFREIAGDLQNAHLIRSSAAFDLYALFGGRALALKSGLYRLSASMTGSEILRIISGGSAGQVTVTIPEGSNLFEVDAILSKALVIRSGDLIRLQASEADGTNLEGKLFPDTYEFYTNADVSDVVKEMTDNFNTKAEPLLAVAGKNATSDVVLASMLEKEVPDQTDREIVAGIMLKRIAAGMPLDIDATVCYARLLAADGAATGCPSLTALDFKIKSPYNTYLYKGLPPGPIGNPGISAITAALHPQSSPYWYYLSDPKTGKTVFAKTLDEQTQNRVKYLESD